MIFLKKDSPWNSFLWSAVSTLTIVGCILLISRNQLHEETIGSDARFLKTTFEKNLEDAFLQNLEFEILNQGKENKFSAFLELDSLLNEAAVACLNIPNILGIQAYDPTFTSLNLSTSVTHSRPDRKYFIEAVNLGWAYRKLDAESLTLLVPIRHDNEWIFIEFSLAGEPFENSWNEIDSTLIKQGLILGTAMLFILWVIFRFMIRKITAKENLLFERTEVLQKTNQELSRAYKTTSLGAITGHLMHGLRNQLTTLKNLASEDGDLKQQIDKMQDFVQQSLGSIKEAEKNEISYILTMGELFQIAQSKCTKLFPETTLEIKQSECLSESINNLQANLALAILTNLFQNSTEARQGAGLSLSCVKKGGYMEVDISDNGTGIPEELLGHLFEPVISKKKDGSGIGLALSRQLAESMGGSLTILHSDQQGTTFRLCIPSMQ